MFWILGGAAAAAVLALFSLIVTVYVAFKTAPYLGSSKEVIRQALSLAGPLPNEVLVDLGSGNGRVIVLGAREFGLRANGFELSPHHYAWSYLKIIVLGLGKRVRVRWSSFLTADLKDADIIFCFLTPKALIELEKKFERELKAGSRVVAYSSRLPSWMPRRIEDTGAGKLYLYVR